MRPVLLLALVFFVLAFYGYRWAERYGPRVTLPHEPADAAHIHHVIHRQARPLAESAAQGFRPGFTQDDRAVADAQTRRQGIR